MARRRTDTFQTVLIDLTHWVYIVEKYKKNMIYNSSKNKGMKCPKYLLPKGSTEIFVWEK